MKVALIGASGRVGSRILAELLHRHHEVTGIVRHVEKLASQAGLTLKQGDVNDESSIAEILKGHDAVVSAIKFQIVKPHALIRVVQRSGVNRFFVVGGAGSLEVAPGLQLVDTPNFPPEYKPESLAGRKFLQALRREHELDWTYLSPSADFLPGKRTGKFRLDKDQLITSPNGESKISFEDFAVALVDEIERPRHSKQRFTVGY